LTDEDAVPQAVASPLGIAALPSRTITDSLLQELRDKMILLILDNCEHLLDSCAQLAELILKNCPDVSILATSRDLLRVEGEASYHLPSLRVPQSHDTTSLDELVQNEAVQLFAERAALVASNFKITEANIGTVIQICDRLDGIPLAIELAAAHIDIFNAEELLEQLNRSFDLLVSNTRSVLPRHQTMRTSIDWGWNLLSETERVFVRRISVFIGGWTLHSAQVVSSGNVLELTSTLLKKSFIIAHQQSERETRYSFHEVVRSYAQEKLIEAGEEGTMRDRHLQYFLDLTRQFEPALRGVDQELWLEQLFLERDNIRAALGWAARMHVQAGLYLSNRLRTFWERYEFREEARWLLMI
jgi:predicted ATPase